MWNLRCHHMSHLSCIFHETCCIHFNYVIGGGSEQHYRKLWKSSGRIFVAINLYLCNSELIQLDIAKKLTLNVLILSSSLKSNPYWFGLRVFSAILKSKRKGHSQRSTDCISNSQFLTQCEFLVIADQPWTWRFVCFYHWWSWRLL